MTDTPFIAVLRAQAEVPEIAVVDVGASSLGGRQPVYRGLLDAGLARLVGFEPNLRSFGKLQETKGPRETYVPKAVGDGGTHALRICAMTGMDSLLEPDHTLLDLTYHHGRWGRVLRTVDVETVRLDDVPEAAGMDYLKIDIQGGEVMVFEHAGARLADCLVVHTEAMFIPLYEGQPLFSEQELALRPHGLRVHRMLDVAGHVLRPFKVNGSDHEPLSQLFQADVVFIKDITRPDRLSDEQLLKLAIILHETYRSVDVAHLFLAAYDARRATTLAAGYVSLINRGG